MLFIWQNKKYRYAIISLDLILVLFSFLLAYKLIWPGLSPILPDTGKYLQLCFLLILNSYLCFSYFKTYLLCQTTNQYNKIFIIWLANDIAVILTIAALFFLKIEHISRLLLFLHWIVASTLITIRFILFQKIFCQKKKDLKEVINIIVIGSKERAKETIKTILNAPGSFYKVIGCLEIDENEIGKKVVDGVSVIAHVRDLKDILLNKIVDVVIFALPLKQVPNVIEHISFAEKLGVDVKIMPDWQIQKIMFRPETASVCFENFVGLPCLSISSLPKQDIALLIKRIMDILGSAAALVVLFPLFLVIALAIKATSEGPVLFKQKRVGLNGRLFTMYKFRTMVKNAEELKKELIKANEMKGPAFKLSNDPRVTKIGKFLRKTSLDELPQFYNVLKGDMSLVGPRPPLPEEVKQYLPHQRRRLSMRPGITCIWQVSGRNRIRDFEEWMRLDLKYIDEWSLWLDIKLIFLTFKAIITGSGK